MAATPSAGAQEAEAAAEAAEASVLDDPRLEAVRGRLGADLRAAARAGLPVPPLEDKIREGLAKRAPPPLIAGAVSSLLGHLRTADGMLRPVRPHPRVARPELVRLTAEALVAGADARELGQLVQTISRSEGDGAAPVVRDGMTVVSELVERGVDGAVAAEGARTAFHRHGTRGWRALVRAVRALGPTTAGERARVVRRAAQGSPGAPGWDGAPSQSKGQGKGKGR
jgi:hypothetical protein